MRILIYNWVVFDQNSRGGGVTVYTRNLIENLLKAEHDVSFLCAGSYYDKHNVSIRYEKIDTLYEGKCAVYSIINSPVFAPAYIEFFHLDSLFNDKGLKHVLEEFFLQEGPFDVVHFQNLEGLSIDALSVKKMLAGTSFVLSLHNYHVFCPRVDLWRNDCLCQVKTTGASCLDCMICHPPAKKLIEKMTMTYELKKDYSSENEKRFLDKAKIIDQKYREIENNPILDSDRDRLSKILVKYRSDMVDAVNSFFDSVLAVSKRVESIAISMGIEKSKIQTSYIGTEVAEHAINKYKRKDADVVTIVYLGYRRKEKGFFYFVDALNRLSNESKKNLNVIIAARGDMSSDGLIIGKEDFHGFQSQNGYERDELERILSLADFGVVPVLWEDNLPQVAIEMASRGVPYICTDRGGASELTNSHKFIFPADNVKEFSNKIEYFVKHADELGEFYEGYVGLTTMSQNIAQLMNIYDCNSKLGDYNASKNFCNNAII